MIIKHQGEIIKNLMRCLEEEIKKRQNLEGSLYGVQSENTDNERLSAIAVTAMLNQDIHEQVLHHRAT
jgi:hypothetical protein